MSTLQIVLLIVVPVLMVFVGILSNWISPPAGVKTWHVLTGLAILLVISIALGVIQEPDPGDDRDPQNPTTAVEGVGLSVASSEKHYRAILYLNNSTDNEKLIDRIHLLVGFPSGACAELPPVVLYKVQDEIGIDASGTVEAGTVSAESGPMSGLQTPATGTLNTGCLGEQLQLTFSPPGGILERNQTTPIAIDIPKNIKVTERKIPDEGPVSETRGIPEVIPGVAHTPPLAFRVIAEIKSMPNIDSCFLLSDSPPSGKLDCDYVEQRRHIFWRQIYVSATEVREER